MRRTQANGRLGPRPSAGVAPHGGPDGNARLTGSTGAMLIALLGVEALTVLSLGSLLSLHIFIGVLLIPPVILKLASTDYALLHRQRALRRERAAHTAPTGARPDPGALGGSAPGNRVLLLAVGPGDGPVRGLQTELHRPWHRGERPCACHLSNVAGLAAADWRKRTRLPGSAIRRFAVLASLLAGLAFGAAAVHYTVLVHRRTITTRRGSLKKSAPGSRRSRRQ